MLWLITVLRSFGIASALVALTLSAANLHAQQAPADTEQTRTEALAKKLQNPIANLISLPIQSNWDFGIGQADAMRYTANIQPVIPFSISTNWNVITRTILPVIYAESPAVGGSSMFGLGDSVQSFFFSPKTSTSGGWIWGAGPVFLWPTSTDDAFGGKVGAGPTAVMLRQASGWTYGLLANHLRSFAGRGNVADVNATFIQPFVTYTTKTSTSFGISTETTYDWERSQWIIPMNFIASQLLKVGGAPVQFTFGTRYYAEKPSGGPDWGLRFVITFLIPR